MAKLDLVKLQGCTAVTCFNRLPYRAATVGDKMPGKSGFRGEIIQLMALSNFEFCDENLADRLTQSVLS